MNTYACTARCRGLFIVLLAWLALAAPAALQAQNDDTYQHFTVTVSKTIRCDVTICHYTNGGGVCSVFSPGTSTPVSGTGPFTIIDVAGTAHPVSDRTPCTRNVLIGSGCCVDVCYSLDHTASPVLTVTPSVNFPCPHW